MYLMSSYTSHADAWAPNISWLSINHKRLFRKHDAATGLTAAAFFACLLGTARQLFYRPTCASYAALPNIVAARTIPGFIQGVALKVSLRSRHSSIAAESASGLSATGSSVECAAFVSQQHHIRHSCIVSPGTSVTWDECMRHAAGILHLTVTQLLHTCLQDVWTEREALGSARVLWTSSQLNEIFPMAFEEVQLLIRCSQRSDVS